MNGLGRAAGNRRSYRVERLVSTLRDCDVLADVQKRIVDARTDSSLGRQQPGVFTGANADIVVAKLQRVPQQQKQQRGRRLVVFESSLFVERVEGRLGGIDQPLQIILAAVRVAANLLCFRKRLVVDHPALKFTVAAGKDLLEDLRFDVEAAAKILDKGMCCGALQGHYNGSDQAAEPQ